MGELVCAGIFFSHWPVFLFTVKAGQESFSQIFPPQKSNGPLLIRDRALICF